MNITYLFGHNIPNKKKQLIFFIFQTIIVNAHKKCKNLETRMYISLTYIRIKIFFDCDYEKYSFVKVTDLITFKNIITNVINEINKRNYSKNILQ